MSRESYEISIWKDVYDSTLGRYVDQKVAVIGSDELDAEMHAFEPKLVENINGSNTFSFKMFINCKDQVTGKTYMNPLSLELVNERKVKVKWRNEWYDFIVKNCQEMGDKNTVEYTCTDAYINELSKTGFGLEFDIQLENNQGTAEELAARVVNGTEWRALKANKYALKVENNKVVEDSFQLNDDNVNPEIIKQEKEEPVYEILSIGANIPDCKNDTTGDEDVEILAGANILLFYSQISDLYQLTIADTPVTSGSQQFQFAYSDTNEYSVIDGSQLVDNADCYTSPVLNWGYGNGQFTINNGSTTIFTFYFSNVSSKYRANRLVRSQLSTMDPLTEHYCDIFTKQVSGEEHEIYFYTDTKVESAVAVANVIANPTTFTDTTGWEIQNPMYKLCPDPSTIGIGAGKTSLENYTAVSCLRLDGSVSNFNEGLKSCASYLRDGLQKGSVYVFRYKIHENIAGTAISGDRPAEEVSINGSTIGFDLGTIDASGDYKVIGTSIISIDSAGDVKEANRSGQLDGWHYCLVTLTDSRSYSDLVSTDTTRNVGMFLTPTSTVWIEEAQFFKYVESADGPGDGNITFIVPGNFSTLSPVKKQYNYYDNTIYKSQTRDDIQFLYQGTTNLDLSTAGLTPKLNENYEKIRSITERQSNRFNLIQSIAEQFDCWAHFYIGHNADGSIQYDSSGMPYKFVYFTNTLGQDTGIGFVYGIDLKDIQRTIESENIVTKTIVIPNNNEFALYGSCDISRANGNYSKNSSIYNFDYYLSHDLLDGEQLNKDLYGYSESGVYYRGYYNTLHDEYTNYDYYTDLIVKLLNEDTKLRSYATLYDSTVKSCDKLITSYKARILNASGYPGDMSSLASANQYFATHTTSDSVNELLISWRTTESKRAEAYANLIDCQAGIAIIQDRLEDYYEAQDSSLSIIETAESNFFKKYSRFIQEGSWQSDDYIDDTLYYIDGVALAYRSARPQVSYNISIMRVSALEEFKYKVFKLGDITYVQDEEFFGLIKSRDGFMTPYRERVVISEMTSYFDEPDKDSFTVQNYKTNLDDLFQRITATTQALRFNEGDYARAANVVTSTGAISASALQATLNANKQLTMAAVNDTVVQDSNGITLSSVEDPSRKVRVNSNGLFMTTDGGVTWNNAVRSSGLATEALAAGALDVNQIAIYDGNLPTFRWDQYGINAFSYMYDTGHEGDPNYMHVSDTKYVRFDRFGLYGVDGISSSWIPNNEQEVWTYGKFGLTWNGFFLKTNHIHYSNYISNQFEYGYIILEDEDPNESGTFTTMETDIVDPESGVYIWYYANSIGSFAVGQQFFPFSNTNPIQLKNISVKTMIVNICSMRPADTIYVNDRYRWLVQNYTLEPGQEVSISPDPSHIDFNQFGLDYKFTDETDIELTESTVSYKSTTNDIRVMIVSDMGSIEITSDNDISVAMNINGTYKRNMIKIGWIEGETYEGITDPTVGILINKLVGNNLQPVFKMTNDGVLIIGDFTIDLDSFTYDRTKYIQNPNTANSEGNYFNFKVVMKPEGFTAAYYPRTLNWRVDPQDSTQIEMYIMDADPSKFIRGFTSHFSLNRTPTDNIDLPAGWNHAVQYMQIDTNFFVGGYGDITYISSSPTVMDDIFPITSMPQNINQRGLYGVLLPNTDSLMMGPIENGVVESLGNGNETHFMLRFFNGSQSSSYVNTAYRNLWASTLTSIVQNANMGTLSGSTTLRTQSRQIAFGNLSGHEPEAGELSKFGIGFFGTSNTTQTDLSLITTGAYYVKRLCRNSSVDLLNNCDKVGETGSSGLTAQNLYHSHPGNGDVIPKAGLYGIQFTAPVMSLGVRIVVFVYAGINNPAPQGSSAKKCVGRFVLSSEQSAFYTCDLSTLSGYDGFQITCCTIDSSNHLTSFIDPEIWVLRGSGSGAVINVASLDVFPDKVYATGTWDFSSAQMTLPDGISLPALPTNDGTYYLCCNVVNGSPSVYWF